MKIEKLTLADLRERFCSQPYVKRVNPVVPPKRIWGVDLKHQGDLVIPANTKSEARAKVKKILEGSIPVGTVITELEQ